MATVNIEDLEPNSHSYKKELEEERKKEDRLTPVVQKNAVVSTKKSLGKKFSDTFLSSDGAELKDYIWKDLILPGIKNWIISSLKMAFFHEEWDPRDDRSYTGRSSYGGRHYDYSGRYRSRDDRSVRDRNNRYSPDDKIDYRNIILDRRVDAEKIVDMLHDRIDAQRFATVADLFDLVGLDSRYTDNNWGWRRFDDIRIQRVASGFLIDVREAEYVGD